MLSPKQKRATLIMVFDREVVKYVALGFRSEGKEAGQTQKETSQETDKGADMCYKRKSV